MTPRDFCYWLQGYVELSEAGRGYDTLDAAQMRVVKDHLALVLSKETPHREPAEWRPGELLRWHGPASC